MMPDYPFKWLTESVAVGYAPRSENDLQQIREAGIDTIVNLCAECYDLSDAESSFGFQVYYLPIFDEDAPELAQLEELIAWMHVKTAAGHRVLVHCRYGIGRTGTITLSYLIDSGHGFKEAKSILKKTPAWPSTRVQQELVDQFITRKGYSSIAGGLKESKPSGISRFFDRWEKLSRWS
jgi:protein-tyrosine phosphatase